MKKKAFDKAQICGLLRIHREGGGQLAYMGYIGTCHGIGYGF